MAARPGVGPAVPGDYEAVTAPISAENNPFNRIEHYRLELVTGEVDRTTWWKDENRREPANVWWITGPGTSRPATDIEIDLWLQFQGASR